MKQRKISKNDFLALVAHIKMLQSENASLLYELRRAQRLLEEHGIIDAETQY